MASQVDPARPRHDGGARRSIQLIRRSLRRKRTVDLAHLRRTIPRCTATAAEATRSHASRSRAAAHDVVTAAPQAAKFYDIVVQVAIIPAGPIVE